MRRWKLRLLPQRGVGASRGANPAACIHQILAFGAGSFMAGCSRARVPLLRLAGNKIR